jgi:hypothetical protein
MKTGSKDQKQKNQKQRPEAKTRSKDQKQRPEAKTEA